MGIIDNTVYAPASADEIRVLLGLSSSYNDVGQLCANQHGRINRWAKYKPVRISKWAELTEAEFIANNFGLTAVKIDDIAKATNGDPVASIPATAIWIYAAPRTSENFRLTDFTKPGYTGNGGYNHTAKCPVSDVSSLKINNNDFEQWDIANNNTPNAPYTKIWYPSFRYGAASNEFVGNNSGKGMEISMYEFTLINGSTMTDGNWRMGLALFYTYNGKYLVHMASTPNAILKASNPGDIMIDIMKGSRVREFLRTRPAGTVVTVIPCFCYRLSYITTPTENYWSFLTGGAAFPFPGGETITITREGTPVNELGRLIRFGMLSNTTVGGGIGPTYSYAPGAYPPTYRKYPQNITGGLTCIFEATANFSAALNNFRLRLDSITIQPISVTIAGTTYTGSQTINVTEGQFLDFRTDTGSAAVASHLNAKSLGQGGDNVALLLNNAIINYPTNESIRYNLTN